MSLQSCPGCELTWQRFWTLAEGVAIWFDRQKRLHIVKPALIALLRGWVSGHCPPATPYSRRAVRCRLCPNPNHHASPVTLPCVSTRTIPLLG